MSLPPTRVDDRDSRIHCFGPWFDVTTDNPLVYSGTLSSTSVENAGFVFTFRGTAVSVFGTVILKNNVLPPTIRFSIDGGPPLYFTALNLDVEGDGLPFFVSEELSPNLHTIIANTTRATGDSSFYLDYMDVVPVASGVPVYPDVPPPSIPPSPAPSTPSRPPSPPPTSTPSPTPTSPHTTMYSLSFALPSTLPSSPSSDPPTAAPSITPSDTPSFTPTSTSAMTVSSGGTSNDSQSSLQVKNSPAGAIVGGVIGGVASVILILLIVWCCRRRRKHLMLKLPANAEVKTTMRIISRPFARMTVLRGYEVDGQPEMTASSFFPREYNGPFSGPTDGGSVAGNVSDAGSVGAGRCSANVSNAEIVVLAPEPTPVAMDLHSPQSNYTDTPKLITPNTSLTDLLQPRRPRILPSPLAIPSPLPTTLAFPHADSGVRFPMRVPPEEAFATLEEPPAYSTN